MPQLTAYYRPNTIQEAVQLLNRSGVETAVLGGGTSLVAELPNGVTEVVDLQTIGLTPVHLAGEHLTIGAMVNLQTLVETEQLPALLRETAHREGPNTFRHAATVGGVVAGADPESELLAALLVFEADVHLQTEAGAGQLPLATFLQNKAESLTGSVITAVSLNTNGRTASDRVGRTPADKPIVAAVARQNENGRILLALCGMAATPILADPAHLPTHPPADFRGSTAYRREIAAVLTRRVLAQLKER